MFVCFLKDNLYPIFLEIWKWLVFFFVKGEFALNCGIKALEYFTDFFMIPYPLGMLAYILDY